MSNTSNHDNELLGEIKNYCNKINKKGEIIMTPSSSNKKKSSTKKSSTKVKEDTEPSLVLKSDKTDPFSEKNKYIAIIFNKG